MARRDFRLLVTLRNFRCALSRGDSLVKQHIVSAKREEHGVAGLSMAAQKVPL